MSKPPPSTPRIPLATKKAAVIKIWAEMRKENPSAPRYIISVDRIAEEAYGEWLRLQLPSHILRDNGSAPWTEGELVTPVWAKTEVIDQMVTLGREIRRVPKDKDGKVVEGYLIPTCLSCTNHIQVLKRKWATGETPSEVDFRLAVAGIHHTDTGTSPTRKKRRRRGGSSSNRGDRHRLTHFYFPNCEDDLFLIVNFGLRVDAAYDQVRNNSGLMVDAVTQGFLSAPRAELVWNTKANRAAMDEGRLATWGEIKASLQRRREQRQLEGPADESPHDIDDPDEEDEDD